MKHEGIGQQFADRWAFFADAGNLANLAKFGIRKFDGDFHGNKMTEI